MPTLRSGDAQLFYELTGSGPDVILLHPFPLSHHFWTPVAEQLSSLYRLVLPDLRAHGDSELGDGPATMQKLAGDLAILCRELRIQRPSSWAFPSAAIFCSSSGGSIASRSRPWSGEHARRRRNRREQSRSPGQCRQGFTRGHRRLHRGDAAQGVVAHHADQSPRHR